jgi:hypothetical protein
LTTETDGIIGNEVTNATSSGGLIRSGSGTAASPYTLGIASSGVTGSHIADGAITNTDISATADIAGSKLADKSIAITKVNATGTASSLTYLRGDGSWAAPAGDGQGVTSVSGANGISVTNGTTTPTVSLPAGTTSGNVLKWNGTAWSPATESGLTTETDGIIGNEVTNATSSGGLVRSGSGTSIDPYTLGIAENGVTSAKIANGTIKAEDLSSMEAGSGQVMTYDGSVWRPGEKMPLPTVITSIATEEGSVTSGSYTDVYIWPWIEQGLYSLRVKTDTYTTAKFIVRSDMSLGTFLKFEVDSDALNYGDRVGEVLFNVTQPGPLRLKASCTSGCPSKLLRLYLARY